MAGTFRFTLQYLIDDLLNLLVGNAARPARAVFVIQAIEAQPVKPDSPT